MNITKKIGFLLLGIWLIVFGLVGLLEFSFQGMHLVQGGLAIAAGVFVLLER